MRMMSSYHHRVLARCCVMVLYGFTHTIIHLCDYTQGFQRSEAIAVFSFVRHRGSRAATTQFLSAKDDLPSAPVFADWASLGDIKTESIAVADFEGIRGVQAEEDIQSGTVIMSVPKALCLEDFEDDLLAETPFGKKVPKEDWQALDLFWMAKLALVFAHERARGSASPWAAWLGSLPAAGPPVPGAWGRRGGSAGAAAAGAAAGGGGGGGGGGDGRGRAARAELQDPRLQAEVDGTLFWLSSQYDQLNHLAEENGMNLGHSVNKEQFLDTVYNIQSRAFLMDIEGQQRRFLIPFMDMFNHKPDVPSEFFYNKKTESVDLKIDYSVQAGEQVFINYGEFTNSEFLKYYGFVPENNQQNDNVAFDGVCEPDDLKGLGLKSEDFRPETGKTAALAAFSQMVCDDEECTFTAGLPGLQDEFVAALRLSVATAPELAQAGGPAAILDSVGDNPAVVLSRANEVRVARVAARRCARALAAHPTSAAEDRRALRAAAAAAGGRPRAARAAVLGPAGAAAEAEARALALRYRLARKELLAGLAGRLEAYAAYAEAGGEGEGELLPSLNAFLYWSSSVAA